MSFQLIQILKEGQEGERSIFAKYTRKKRLRKMEITKQEEEIVYYIFL